MKTFLIIVVLVLLLIIVAFFALGLFSHTGKPAGLIDGYLTSCPETSNCALDSLHVAPNQSPETIVTIKDIIQNMGGHIDVVDENYLAATFTSTIFRFVDDLEIVIDPSNDIVHIRSASRVGKSDLGANRSRITLLKMLIKQHVDQ